MPDCERLECVSQVSAVARGSCVCGTESATGYISIIIWLEVEMELVHTFSRIPLCVLYTVTCWRVCRARVEGSAQGGSRCFLMRSHMFYCFPLLNHPAPSPPPPPLLPSRVCRHTSTPPSLPSPPLTLSSPHPSQLHIPVISPSCSFATQSPFQKR